MSERERYPAGVPCWVTVMRTDPRAAMDFYGPLFGWEPLERPGYVVARLRGRDVAGVGVLPWPDVAPAWITQVRVDSAEDAAARARAAGGTVVDGPLDLPPAGRLAVLADPAGAVFCAWEAAGREGAQLVNEPGAWSMSALQTHDPEGAIAFYRAVFGWEPEPFGPATMFRLPGYVGGEPQQPVPRDVVAVMMPAEPGAPPRWSVDFWVNAAAATAERAERLGGRVVVPVHEQANFRTAVLADPEGATFSISQLVVEPGAADS
jgi:predicted enzyme related to lactoylglutathione lyase